MEETVICKMCLEPIFNFICIDCLGKDVHSWLSTRPDILTPFTAFQKNLFKYFSTTENLEKCIRCGDTTDTVLCPYCYANEVFWLIFSKDKKLAAEFAKIFNFDFQGPGYMVHTRTRDLQPIILVDDQKKPDMNICDNCGQFSDYLKEKDGAWLCESCLDSIL
jgi:hypothetical protein